MSCHNESCKTGESQVLLTRNVGKPVWFCGYCAAAFLSLTNLNSFSSTNQYKLTNRKPSNK